MTCGNPGNIHDSQQALGAPLAFTSQAKHFLVVHYARGSGAIFGTKTWRNVARCQRFPKSPAPEARNVRCLAVRSQCCLEAPLPPLGPTAGVEDIEAEKEEETVAEDNKGRRESSWKPSMCTFCWAIFVLDGLKEALDWLHAAAELDAGMIYIDFLYRIGSVWG